MGVIANRRRLMRCVMALTLSITGVAVADVAGRDPVPHPTAALQKPDGPAIGSAAPHFWMRTANPRFSKMDVVDTRKLFSSPEQPTPRAVVLSFTASYCKPCRQELPDLARLAERFRRFGLIWAVVVIDTQEEGQKMMRKRLVDEMQLAAPVLFDRFAIVARRYGVDKLPHLVLMDDTWRIRWASTGTAEETLRGLSFKLHDLLPESSTATAPAAEHE